MKKIILLSKYLINLIRNRFVPKKSYSQSGEDLIIDFIFKWLRRESITYLDIGTNDPKKFNNTYFFYKNNHRGVLVEPDIRLFRKNKKYRRYDEIINAGIGLGKDKYMNFYSMSPDTLSTTSLEVANRYIEMGVKLKETKVIELININDLIEDKFLGLHLDLLSIDVEGLDFDIIQSINLEVCRPTVICAETLTFSTNNRESKISNISNYLLSKGYFIYADTYLNTIFVDQEVWDSRFKG